jgi:hypothetical protein
MRTSEVKGDVFVSADICDSMVSTYLWVIAVFGNEKYKSRYRCGRQNSPPRVLIGGPPCWTWVMILASPPAAAIVNAKLSRGLDPSVYGGGGSRSSAEALAPAAFDVEPAAVFLISSGRNAFVSARTRSRRNEEASPAKEISTLALPVAAASAASSSACSKLGGGTGKRENGGGGSCDVGEGG